MFISYSRQHLDLEHSETTYAFDHLLIGFFEFILLRHLRKGLYQRSDVGIRVGGVLPEKYIDVCLYAINSLYRHSRSV